MKWLFIIFISFMPLFATNLLQNAIDSAKPGSLLTLPAGIYKGNIVINKPLIIDGKNQKTIIQGDGKGTVIRITSSYVTLKNLTIRHSGINHEGIDSGVSIIKAKHCNIIHCRFVDDLFGINMEKASQCHIAYNYITSKPFSVGLRGDALKLWYSNDNILEHNYVTKSRDFVIWFSNGNLIQNNYGQYGRYALHFMYTGKNIVKNNLYKHNLAGIFFMYSQDSIATGNVIESSIGTTGLGIGLQDASNFIIKNNTIIYCAIGFFLSRSSYHVGTYNYFLNNKILYNTRAIKFLTLSKRDIFKGNIFKGNIENIDNASISTQTTDIVWNGNYWDDYQGFDKNNDGIGDTPYIDYLYADKLWLLNPDVRFFFGSPVMSIMDFLDKLAPFSKPIKLAEDKHPVMSVEDIHEYKR